MKKIILIFFVVFVPATLFAQKEEGGKPDDVMKINTELGVGQEWSIGGMEISFLKVISDSRCPRRVTCIWPGEAKVLLGIKLKGRYFEKELKTSGEAAKFSLLNDILIKIDYLSPYPEVPEGIASEEYCLSFSAFFEAED